MRKKQVNKPKMCPFLDEKCIQSECAIYNEAFQRCEIGLLIYNVYQLTTAIKQQLDDDSE